MYTTSSLSIHLLMGTWKHKAPQITKTILRKKNKAGGIMLSDFKI